MTNPASPKEGHSWFSKTKGKMKKAFQPAKGNNNGSTASSSPHTSTLSSSHPTPTSTVKTVSRALNDPSPPKLAPVVALEPASVVPPSFNPDIFPSQIARTNDIHTPKIAHRIDSTAQLVHCARLLQLMESPSFSLSAPASLSTNEQLNLSKEDREWMKNVENLSVEKDRIHQLLTGVANEFILDPIKDEDAIREVIIVGPVLRKDHFRALLNCLLAEFRNAPLLEIGKLPGLVQLVQDAPPDYLETNDLIDILELIRKRLEGTDTHSEKYLFQLTMAISKVLSVMADLNIKELDRVEQHQPLRTILAGMKIDSNPYLRYQAIYAVQALRCVPDDETPSRCFFRHFVNVAGAAIKLSGVMQADINGFAGGVKEIQSSLTSVISFVKSTVEEDIPAFMENGAGLVDCLKNMIKSDKRHPWYVSLRAAEDLIKVGNFLALKELFFAAPSRDSYLFQWGYCQLLGEIAVDPSWDRDTRCQAVQFLGEIYKLSSELQVKEWILTILSYISTFTDEPTNAEASILIENLSTGNEGAPQPHYFVGRRLPLPKLSPLLFKVNKTANLEPTLLKIKWEITQGRRGMYVPLMSKANPKDSGEKLDPLDQRVFDFLASKKEVMLILGGSGSGKTTFNEYLERTLWEQYQPGGPIPLFIDLKAMGNLNQVDIAEKKLSNYLFKPEEIRELKEYRRIILICDGYDEAKTFANIHKQLKSQRWMSFQVVVSCRSQYLANANYRSFFAPQTTGQKSQALSLFDEAVVMPFRDDQIRDYIEKFRDTEDAKDVFGERPIWSTDYYFKQLGSLMELVKNPFMLRLALTTLPGIVDGESGLPKVLTTRFELFLAFGKQHFEKELDKLSEQRGGNMPADEASAFDILQSDFFSCGIHFSMRLAHAIFVKNEGVNLVEYSPKEKPGWKTPFFSPKTKAEIRLLRGTIQVARHFVEESGRYGISSSKDVYSFIHRSIMEFYCACQLCDIIADPLQEHNHAEESQHTVLAECLDPAASPLLLSGHPLNHRSIISEPSIVHFLVEHSQMHPEFQEQLRQVVERSKIDKTVSQAAANSITVLVKAGYQFSGEDLSGIQIPGADISNGYFDSAILRDADLTDVNLASAWLRQADFTGAIMNHVQLGEQPYFMFKEPMAGSMAISHSGEELAIGFEDGTIKVFATSDWSTRLTLRGHTDRIWRLSFCRTSHQLASASADSTIRIWDLHHVKPCRILNGHTAAVKAIIFSPDGSQVATASADNTVRTWDIESETTDVILDNNFYSLGSITWSTDGELIASGNREGIVRLWDAKSGKVVREMQPSTKAAASTIFAPDGKHLVTCADNNVYLWDLETEGEPIVMKGHAEYVSSVMVSRDSLWIASASSDRTVRIWDGRSGAPVLTLTGHTSSVGKVLFLDDHKLVSFGYNDMMRFWDLSRAIKHDGVLSGISQPKDLGHSATVKTVAFSLDGTSIVTGSLDKSVKVWDVATGASKTVIDSPCQVLSEAATPDNQPKTVQDWNEDSNDVPRVTAAHAQTAVLAVTFTPEGHPVALTKTTEESMVYCLQVKEAETIHFDTPIQAYSNVSMTVCSPCGRWIALGESSGNIQLWDRQSGTVKGHLVGHTDEIKGLVFSHDGQQLASWSADLTGRIWTIEDLTCKGVMEHELEALAFSPCGTMIAWNTVAFVPLTQRDYTFWSTIHIWDLSTMQRIHALRGHDSRIGPLAWSSEGILSCDDEETVRLWKWQPDGPEPSWSCVAIVRDFGDVVHSVRWNPDASTREFVTGCANGSVSVWVVTEDKTDGSDLIQLKWGSDSRLTATTAKITGAVGLESSQRTLLRQKGAIDDSAPPEEVEGKVIGPE